MPDVNNNFITGIMNSDTHYSLIDNKSYVRAENLRISGDGDDGSLKNMKGSEVVSDYSENGQMTVLGMHKGLGSKMYYFLGMPNGKSKIVEYDVESGVSRLIIEDTSVLRFDLIRWKNGVEIRPLKYLLSFNQIGDQLIFSNEAWENIRSVNLKRIAEYSLGFTESDITLNKKPPNSSPKIIEFLRDSNVTSKTKKDSFWSFAYRYKYNDGDWSALSFFSDTAFQMGGYNVKNGVTNEVGFRINSERLNEGMTNKYNAVKIIVNSGGKNVTDIQVIAREHNTNETYIIYNANKKKLNIPDNIDNFANPNFQPIIFRFSNNYKLLSDDAVKMLYSKIAKFPKTQDVAGSRLFIANYMEGYDLKDKNGNDINIDISFRKDSLPANLNGNNTTAASLFTYSIGQVYFDDHNESTTVLGNSNQNLNELETSFADRLHRNIFKAKPNHNPPAFATKFKWVVKTQELNYETLYITYLRKIGVKVYLLLSGDNINRLRKGDVIYRIDDSTNANIEYNVLEVKEYSIDDGMPIKGFYAQIETGQEFLYNTSGQPNVNKNYEKYWAVIDSVYGTANPERFDATSGYQGIYDGNTYSSLENRGKLLKSDYGTINEGDKISIRIAFTYGRDKKGRGEDAISISGTVEINSDMYASSNYPSIYEFMVDNFINAYILMDNPSNGNEVRFLTNNEFPDLVKATGGWIYEWMPNSGKRDERAVVKVKTTVSVVRGIKPIIFRTTNKDVLNEVYYESHKSYPVINGQHIGAEPDGYFDVGFYNAYAWGNGVESYKIKDAFNGKKYSYNFRPNLIDSNGYKRVHRKTDIAYSGIYNYELGVNQLSWFEASEANWKTLPIKYGEIQRIISTDGDISVFFNGKVVNQYYGKAIIADLQGSESLALSNDVLGGYKELDYECGVGSNPEIIAKNNNIIYFGSKDTTRFYIKSGNQIQEINPVGSGFHREGVELLKTHSSFQGSFNEARGEYVIGVDGDFSLVFNMTNKGFTNYTRNSFDYNFGMGGSFFTAYHGEVYENEVTDYYGNFAGQLQTAKLTYVVNPELDSDKIFKAMFLQSNTAWDTTIKTNLTESFIPKEFYTQKESFFYTEILRDIKGNNTAVGIGNIQSAAGNTITFTNNIPVEISIGDMLMVKGSQTEMKITDINGNSVTLQNFGSVTVGAFAYAVKKHTMSFSPDGSPIRGKWMEVTLENNSNDPIEITSSTTNLTKSYL